MNERVAAMRLRYGGLRRASRIGLAVLTLLSPICPAEETSALNRHEFTAPLLGTSAKLVFYSADERTEAARLARDCFALIRECDAIFSDYRDDSEVRLLSGKETNVTHRVSDPLFEVIACAQDVSAKSGGAFDITLGADTKRWRGKRDNPSGPVAAETESRASFRDLTLDPAQKTVSFGRKLEIDLGGIAKGYIADRAMRLLKDRGIRHAAVVIGGETVLSAAPPDMEGWRIGVTNPEQQLIGTMVLSNTAISTSGDSYQFLEIDGERQAHVIDPATRKGMSNRLNVTIQARTAMEADAWATALRVLPTPKALELAGQLPNLEAMFIPLGEKPVATQDFPELKPIHVPAPEQKSGD